VTGLTTFFADPGSIPLEQIPAAIGELEKLKAALWARLAAPVPTVERDQLLTIEEAAERLAVTPDWLRRRPHLPFVRKLSDGVVRFDARGLARWAAQRGPV
jgi:hypothetical protein